MKNKRILAMILSVIMVVVLFPGHAFAAVPENQRPSSLSTNMIIGILNDSRAADADEFPNEPSVTGYTYYYLTYNNGNYSLSTSAWGANFTTNAGNYININAFWNDDRIVRNSSGNAFGYYAPTGLDLTNDSFFVTGFGASFPEDDIIRLWMNREGISGNASDYDLLFYVLKYETGWSSGYHLDAKVVKKNNVVLSYDANKPAGVNADIVLPVSHSVEPNTNITVEDLGNNYKNQTANGLNYSFDGWNTKADGTGTAYTAGNTVTVTENTILYAQWDVTNKYEVSWVNYNDEELDSTGHTISYGDSVPTYSGPTPTRPDDTTHKYIFSHWDLIEGNEPINGVTEDLVYKAVYTGEIITHKATVQVVLNGTFDQDGNRSSSNPGTLTDIDVVTNVDENALYIKAVDGTDYIKLEREDEGIYSNDKVGNGNYLIYRKDDGAYIRIGIQELSINNADRTRYLPYYSVEYHDGFGETLWKEYYYIGSDVDVITDVPEEEGYVFKNWEDEESNTYNSSTALQITDITDSIIQEYVLTAQWELAAKVSVTVVANHNGRSEEPTADLTLHLTKKDAADNYNEVAGTTINVPASDWFNNANLTSTTYDAGVVYEKLDPAAEYAAHAAIAGYRSDTDRNGGAIEVNYDDVEGVYEVTIYLIYDPEGYELEFVVEIDPDIEDRFVPKAVDVKVTRWNETDSRWEVIPQHEHQSVEVAINEATRRGIGKVHVWGFNGDTPYLYRIEVIRVDLGSYQIDMGTSADLINYVSKEEGFFPEGAYKAVVTVESHLEGGNNLQGAHADKSGEELVHHGSILATVTAVPYTISLDPSGGAWEDQTSAEKTIEDRFTIPDLADYKPTMESYTFTGWVIKGTSNGVKASEAIKDYVATAGGTLELQAVWNANITVTGDVVVDLGYPCDDDSRQVLVVLQRREGDGTYYVTTDDVMVPLTAQTGTTYAKGRYTFDNVPNLDTSHYRINVVVAGGGKVYYQNETVTISTGEEIYNKNNYFENAKYEVVLNGDSEAVVNIYMEAEPFELGYKIDTSAIAEGFRPTDLTLDLWHDHHVNGEEEFHQIIQSMPFAGTFNEGVSTIEIFEVPPYHANGQLYDYVISIVDYTITEMGMNNLSYYHYPETEDQLSPFSIRYTGPAEYNEAGIEVEGTTYKQDVILKAIFEPNTYAINYELDGGHWESGNVGPTHHKWSFETEIPTPVRDGYLFNGWTVTAEEDDQTDIYDTPRGKILGKAWTNVTFTANWELDEWTDGNPDAQDLGDGTPDEEQVRIIYVSANPAFGTIKDDKELDIVTLPATVTAEAEAIPVDVNHEFVGWTCEEISFTTDNPVLSHSFTATGGETYVFVAEFKAVDNWNDAEDKDDEPDTVPDVQQVKVTYRSGNRIGGEVSKALEIFNISENPLNATAEATANPGYEFIGWNCEKIAFESTTPILSHTFTATGGETYEFVADFAPVDEWNAGDDTDNPDGTPDMYQVKIHFESANTSMGAVAPQLDIITIPGAVSHGKVTADSIATANSGYKFSKWTHETAEVGTAAALNYEFDATGGREYTFIADFEVIGGGGGGGGGTTRYTLTYETNGGTPISKETYARNTNVKLTKVPTKEGYVFEGWYLDKELTESVNEVKMTKNITVYAAWVEDNGNAGGGGKTPDKLNDNDHFAYVVGYPDGTVKPNANITRAEAVSIFFRLLKDGVRENYITEVNNYTDVNDGDWYNTAISTMLAMDIATGRTETEFMPNEYITRAEFAVLCARFDDTEYVITDEFTDIAEHWAEDDIHEAAAHGWIRGYNDNTFKPDALITRAEAMTLINRVLNRVPETPEDLLSTMIKWPDNSDTSVWYYLPVQEATNSHEYDMKNHVYERWTALREVADWTKYE